jgi:hypothetical protein
VVSEEEELTPAQQAEREAKVRRIVQGFKVFADIGTNAKSRGDLVQRLASNVAARHVLNAQQHPEQQQPVLKTASEVLADWEPVALAAAVEHHAGPDWTDYEPETLADVTGLSSDLITRALCARHILHSNSPFTDWHIFEKMAVACNGRTIDFEHGQELEPHELAWAVAQMRLIDPVSTFSNEVSNYVAFLLWSAGMVRSPIGLECCEPHLLKLLSDHGHAVRKDYEAGRITDATEHQDWLRRVCSRYVSRKYDKLTKELEAL